MSAAVPEAERFGALPQESPQLMGVLNVTPDSFSDGGLYETGAGTEAAIARGTAMFTEGAAIVDVGGESTGPGAGPVPADEEIRRVLPVVRALAFSGHVSVDTYKARTAEECLSAGARTVNDVSGLRADPEMIPVVRNARASIVIMHSKEAPDHPHATAGEKEYGDVTREIAEFLLRRADAALSAGIGEEKIILDPGMGRFLSHDARYSWQVLAELERLVELVRPFPVLIGSSRKGFLGGTLAGRDPVSQLSALAAALKGAAILRTHRPDMAKQFLDSWRLLFPRAERVRPGGARRQSPDSRNQCTE